MPSKKTKESEEQRCRRKLRHLSYLSALLQARSLADPRITIYPCDICDGLHLGHDTVKYTAHCNREGHLRVAALVRRIRRHQRIISAHVQAVQQLRSKLDHILAVYGIDPGLPNA